MRIWMRKLMWSILTPICFFCGISCQDAEENNNQSEPPGQFINDTAAQIRDLSKILASDPDDAKTLLQRGRLFLGKNQLDSAIADLQAAVAYDSTNKWAHFRLAQAYRKNAQIKEQIEHALKAKKYGLEEQQLFIMLGEAYLILQQYQKSIDNLNEALKRGKFEPEAYFYKGLLYKETGNIERAKGNLETALEQNPYFEGAYQALSSILMEEGNHELALEYLETGIINNQDDPYLHYNKGVALTRLGLTDSAKKSYKTALALDSRVYLASFNLGMLQFEDREYEQAAANFKQALGYRPDFEDTKYYLALSLDYSGKDQEALALYKEMAGDEKSEFKGKASYMLRKFNKPKITEADTTNLSE